VTAVIHSEWIKLRSVRSNLIVLTVAVLLAVGVAIIVAIVADPAGFGERPNDITLATSGVQIANLLFGILGVQIIGQEYRFNTIRPTFTAVPNRRNVLLSKLIVILGATLAFGAVMMALSVTVVRVFGPGDVALDGAAYRAIFGTLAFSLGYTAFGFAVGAILRQPVAGIILILAWVFVIENIIVSLSTAVGRWMPFFEGGQMAVVDRSDASNGLDVSHLMSRPVAVVYYFAVIAVLVVIGLVLADRRDA
jgi:ABC-2 type transport system permease protein